MTTGAASASGQGNTNRASNVGNLYANDFFVPPLDDYKPHSYQAPPTVAPLVADLERDHVLILSGDPEVEKLSLACFLALTLQGQLASGGAQPLPVLQWRRIAATQLTESLDIVTEPTIYILPELLPQHIAHNLRTLLKTINQRGHYVIITVEHQRVWQNAFGALAGGQFVQNLRRTTLYTVAYLTKYLKFRLANAVNSLNSDIARSVLLHNKLSGYLLDKIVADLESPDNIDDFLALLTTVRVGQPSVGKLNEFIKDAKANNSRLRRSFNDLPLRKQLLVIALHLFSGLLDDQFFSATDRLVEQAWARREPSLRAVDYGDLNEFEGQYFNYVTEPEGKSIELCLPDQRRSLFEIIWDTHCRHVLSSLEVIIGLLDDSVDERPKDWPLFGSTTRRNRVRRVLYETISDVGLRGVRDIEETLLRLAVHPHLGVQAVAASAIARWEEYAPPSHMEQLLKGWRDPRIRRTIDSFTQTLEPRPKERRETYLLITMAMALGYASVSHAPNQLPPYLHELLSALVEQKNVVVRDDLIYIALPQLLSFHLVQPEVERNVRLLAEDALHNEGIARVLAQLYATNGEELAQTLAQWYDACLAQDPKQLDSAATARRASLLACVCTCYGLINYAAATQPGPLTVDQVANRLRAVLQRDQTAQVRQASLTSLINLRRQQPIELREALQTMTPGEMNQIISELTEAYLAQRRELRNGERTLLLGDKRYDVWPTRPHERPPTTLELELMRWLEDPRDPRAQQIAMRALVTFRAHLDDKLTFEDQNPSAAPVQAAAPTPARARALVGLYPQSFYMHTFVPFMATGWNQLRLTVRGVISELASQFEHKPRQTQRLLADLANMVAADAQGTSGSQTGRYLKQGLIWARRREWIENTLMIVVVLLAIALILAMFTLSTPR